MKNSISELVDLLETGRISILELLNLRQQIGVPFKLHPLGFLACTLMSEGSKKIRLHYWIGTDSDITQSNNFLIHDHVFDFKSWVLYGDVENIEYMINNFGEIYSLYSTRYDGDLSVLEKSRETLRVSEVSSMIYRAGESYNMKAGVLHKTRKSSEDVAFTVMLTNDVSKSSPIVLGSIKEGLNFYSYHRKSLSERNVEEKLTVLKKLIE